MPPWLQKHSQSSSEKNEPEHKGKSGNYASQEKKEHGGKFPSKSEEMSEPQHEKEKMAKEKGKMSVRKTFMKMKGKK